MLPCVVNTIKISTVFGFGYSAFISSDDDPTFTQYTPAFLISEGDIEFMLTSPSPSIITDKYYKPTFTL